MKIKNIKQVIIIVISLSLLGSILFDTFRLFYKKKDPLVKMALLLSKEGLGDRGYNDNAYEGLIDAQDDVTINFKLVNYTKSSDKITPLTNDNYELIIAIGKDYNERIVRAAKKYPKTKFILVDSNVQTKLKNLTIINFDLSKPAYLAGMASALISKTGKIGYLGNDSNPETEQLKEHWIKGAKYINPNIEIIEKYQENRKVNENKKELLGYSESNELYKEKADIVFSAEGEMTIGAINAAHKNNSRIITTGTDIGYLGPENVISSVNKNTGTVIRRVIINYSEGKLKPGIIKASFKYGEVRLIKLDGKGISPQVVKKLKIIEKKMKKNKFVEK